MGLSTASIPYSEMAVYFAKASNCMAFIEDLYFG